MAGKDRRPSDEDAALWRQATDGVTPLQRRDETASPASNVPDDPATPRRRPAASAPPPEPGAAAPPLGHGEAPGVDRRTADNLRRGRMRIEARIDLHGMTQAEAHRALTAFLDGQQEAGRRCVLVVTGKGVWREGAGVLRDAVPRWLNAPALRPKILSFCYAQRKDGGDGALYVLLRRRR